MPNFLQETNPLVSVIIPTFGRPEYLERAVKSVLNQTYSNIEIIVVDDNDPVSEARTLTNELIQKKINDEKIIYIQHERNMNGSVARNSGIKCASGKYFCFLDDDDEMLPKRIELFVKKLESLDQSWGACYSNFVKLKNNGTKDYCGEKRTGKLYVEALMRSLYFCPGSNLFVRASFAKEIGGFDPDFRRNQDLEFLARLLERCKLAFVDDLTLIIHYENKTTNKANPKTAYSKLVQLDDFFLNKFKDRLDKLNPKQAKKVYQYFALERFKYSIRYREVRDGLNNCLRNKVSFWLFIRYLFYMAYRFVTKSSVGFNI